MSRDNQSQEQSDESIQCISIPAHPPQFSQPEIARAYADGISTSRLDAELEDLLQTTGWLSAQEEQGALGAQEEEPVQTISCEDTETLKNFCGLLFFHRGEAVPIFSLSKGRAPLSAQQKGVLYRVAGGALLEAMSELFSLLEQESSLNASFFGSEENLCFCQEREEEHDDDDQGDSCQKQQLQGEVEA